MPFNASEPLEDGGPLDDYPVDRQSCKLLGKTALIVQGLMGVIVIASLVYKRHRETPKRPWRIWLFDVSKQVIGQMFVHGTNVLISDVGSARSAGNACVYYFLNILIDTTFGVAIIYFILHLLTWLFSEKLRLKGFESGQYGSPPSIVYWLRQAGVYVVALTTMKLLVIGLFVVWPGIFKVGAWLLSWLGDKDALQVIFTMGLFPILMNVLQFWLIDSIVKASSGVALPSDTPRPSLSTDREPLFHPSPSDSDSEEDEDDEGPSSLHDVEAQIPARRTTASRTRSRSRSSSFDMKMNKRTSGESERKHLVDGIGIHAYPPSSPPPSSPPPPGSSRPTSPPFPTTTTNRKRRSPPPALHPRSPMVPALNSPDQSRGRSSWDAWEGSEDWAERVGEEEWTGKRIEAAKGEVESVWKES